MKMVVVTEKQYATIHNYFQLIDKGMHRLMMVAMQIIQEVDNIEVAYNVERLWNSWKIRKIRL